MKLNRIIVLLFFVMLSTSISAQSQYGTWTSLSLKKNVGKFNLEAETELRTIYYMRLINRWNIGVNAEYKISKPFSVGLGYQLMNTLDQKYLNYQLRHRFNLDATGKKKFRDFEFSLSEGLQLTTKNDSKRIKDDESIDTYKINPALVWKNSLNVEYDIPKSKLTPGYELQTFYELNNPDGNSFEKIRNTLSLKYKINNNNSVKFFGAINNELGSDDAETSGKYILGLKYTYKF